MTTSAKSILTRPWTFVALVCLGAGLLLLVCHSYASRQKMRPACNNGSNSVTTSEEVDTAAVCRFNNGLIKINQRLYQLPNSGKLALLSAAQLEILYESVLLETTSECSTNRRFGRSDDGGWNLCLVGPFTPKPPCYSFSFGVNNIWEFDDEVAKTFDCHVFTFDPTMTQDSYTRSNRVLFIKEGLHASKGVVNSWSVDSFRGFLQRAKLENSVIDILKMDIEHSEWPALETAIGDGSLKNVKQLLLETHVDKQASAEQYVRYLNIIKALHDLGFRLWHYNWNTFGTYASRWSKTMRTCCHELYYINANFLTDERASRNPVAGTQDFRSMLPISRAPDFSQAEALRSGTKIPYL